MIGSGAVLAPQAPLTLKNLLVLNGARVETLPATTVREFRLDVTTTGITYVDCDSSVNVSEKGYVGGWATTSDGTNADVRGRTVGNTTNGGANAETSASHHYGSIFAPAELGAGGGGQTNGARYGAPGGGAIAITAGTGGVARADGGSVRITGDYVAFGPAGIVSANGVDTTAGGGRIAIRANTKLDLGTSTVQARGGRAATGLDGGARSPRSGRFIRLAGSPRHALRRSRVAMRGRKGTEMISGVAEKWRLLRECLTHQYLRAVPFA